MKALNFFSKENCRWGLGLTYSMLGRIYTYTKNKNVGKARMYFCEAINNFNQITHYRGIYMTLKDIHDLEQKNITEEKEVKPEAKATI